MKNFPHKNAQLAMHCKGFSLIEMLMALLVASLLMAALAPVMIKKTQVASVSADPKEDVAKTVYLTDVGTFDWTPPIGVYTFDVVVVGAGGGGGSGVPYGCAVFTTNSVAQGSVFADDSYCTHTRGDGDINFTLPEGVEEIYVSAVAGAGGGGGGRAQFATEVNWSTSGTYTWTIPQIARGERVLVKMNGAGGGGGGADQGGAGGGASGGYVNWTSYLIPAAKTSVQVLVGGGGGGGNYNWSTGSVGAAGFNGGSAGTHIPGGGGGGASSFDASITAYGGGGGGGNGPGAAGWAENGLWETVFNTGGSGRTGGSTGPSGALGGKGGGDGAAGGGVAFGGAGANGTVGADGRAFGAARGGTGGSMGVAGTGAGGRGQDYSCYFSETNLGGGGAGGGGGGSFWSAGTSATTACRGPGPDTSRNVNLAKAGTGAGGAGASCGWNGGNQLGGAGGNGIVLVRYLEHLIGGTGGQDGPVIPRSRVALSSTMRSGNTITVRLGRGGAGGDEMVAFPNVDSTEIRSMNISSVVAGNTDLTPSSGKSGSETKVLFGATNLARTGSGGCGGNYLGTGTAGVCGGYGTTTLAGDFASAYPGWHGNQSGACNTNFLGTVTAGGPGTQLVFDGISYCGGLGGTAASKSGVAGSIGLGGGGGYATGFGGNGGDGYVKIEWGVPRNLDKSTAVRYSGGGGSAGELIGPAKVTISPLTKTVRYTVGAGGAGATFNTAMSKVQDGSNGQNSIFGVGQTYAVTAKGGFGGLSAKIISTINANSNILTLTGAHGAGANSNCTKACDASHKGASGADNRGGAGGQRHEGAPGGAGGTSISPNGENATNFNGVMGGSGGGGGGAASTSAYGKGGKGADGYIMIQWK